MNIKNTLISSLSACATLLLASPGFALTGDLDTSFSGDGVFTQTFTNSGAAFDLALTSDGKIVVVGQGDNGGAEGNNMLVSRVTADGVLDTTFAGVGFISIDHANNSDDARCVDVLSDGKMIVGGNSTTDRIAFVKINSDGTLDNSFGTAGVDLSAGGQEAFIDECEVDSQGRIVAGGATKKSFLALRRLGDGSGYDTTFNNGGPTPGKYGTGAAESVGYGRSMVLQSDDKVVLVGDDDESASPKLFTVLRVGSNGVLDASFNGNGILALDLTRNASSQVAIVQTDGKIIVAGEVFNGTDNDVVVMRLLPDGSLDNSFDTDGKQTFTFSPASNEHLYSVAYQKNGKIYLLMDTSEGGPSSVGIMRVNADGSLDTSFSGDGKLTIASMEANAILVQDDGKIVIAGNKSNDLMVARLEGDQADIQISGASSSTEFPVDAEFDVTITIKNDSPQSIGDLKAQAVLPSNVTIVSFTADGGTCDSSSLTCTWDSFDASSQKNMVARVKGNAEGDANFQGSIVSGQYVDTDTSNDQASLLIKITAGSGGSSDSSSSGGCSLLR